MEHDAAEQLLDEILASFEAIEAQNMAILQFLKDNGIATDEKLAPYLDQAAAASNVKWRAGRLRIRHLLVSAVKEAEEKAERNSAESAEAAPGVKGEEPSDQLHEQDAPEGQERMAHSPNQSEEIAKVNANRSERDATPSAKQKAEQSDKSEEHAGRNAA
jgi:hypothetical protein